MASQTLVPIDTCIWVPFFNRPQSAQKRAVDALLDDDRAALNGPILAEVLLGFKRAEQADWIASMLRGVRFVETSWEDWRAAARLGRDLAAQGHSLPLSDLVIAATAIHRGMSLYTVDPHFQLIGELERYSA